MPIVEIDGSQPDSNGDVRIRIRGRVRVVLRGMRAQLLAGSSSAELYALQHTTLVDSTAAERVRANVEKLQALEAKRRKRWEQSR